MGDGSVMQLSAGAQVTAKLGGRAPGEECRRRRFTSSRYTASVKPCNGDEFVAKAKGRKIEKYSVERVMAIIEHQYTSGGRFRGADDLITAERILSLITSADGASG